LPAFHHPCQPFGPAQTHARFRDFFDCCRMTDLASSSHYSL
jgi:hypothetical protein